MPFAPDSPLRRLPASMDVRSVLFLDGIRYSIEIIDLAQRRLARTLTGFATEDSGGVSARIVEAMSDAWLIVDSVHRLRELIRQCPGIKQREPEVQLFLRGSARAEELRHYVQHLRTEIGSFISHRRPLWGTLSWSSVSPEGLPETHTIVPGTYYDGLWATSGTFDRERGRFVERVVLAAGPAQLDLADVAEAVERIANWVEAWHASTRDDGVHHGSDVHMHFTVRPVPREREPAAPSDDSPND